MLESTEIGELAEMGDIGRGKSTTMAHKNNPRAAEFTEAVARLGRHRWHWISQRRIYA
jgi:3-carboxy-cis,cis-muconate cycloisomerase